MPQYLTQADIDQYGSDLADFSMRAAAQAVAPHLQNLQSQNAALAQRLAVEARRNLDERVEAAVPNYREIDRDPRLLMRIPSAANRFRLADRCDVSQAVGFRNEVIVHHGSAMLGKHEKLGVGFDYSQGRPAAAHRV
jgi:hypothetical protein